MSEFTAHTDPTADTYRAEPITQPEAYRIAFAHVAVQAAEARQINAHKAALIEWTDPQAAFGRVDKFPLNEPILQLAQGLAARKNGDTPLQVATELGLSSNIRMVAGIVEQVLESAASLAEYFGKPVVRIPAEP